MEGWLVFEDSWIFRDFEDYCCLGIEDVMLEGEDIEDELLFAADCIVVKLVVLGEFEETVLFVIGSGIGYILTVPSAF